MDEQEPADPRPATTAGNTAVGAADTTDPPAGPAEPESQGAAEAEGPRPLGVGVTPTGHAPVDAQLRRLEDAGHLAVSGHLDVYEDVHRGLRDTLADLDRHEK